MTAATFPLPALLRDARVQEVRQPSPTDIVLATHGPLGSAHWLVSAHPVGARFVQTYSIGRNAPRPGHFLLWLRKRLVGARAERVEVADGQVADLTFSGADGQVHLLLEMSGQESNLLLLDAERRMLATLFSRPQGENSMSVYRPPLRLHRYPKTDPPRLPVDEDAEARQLDARWREHVATEDTNSAKADTQRRIRAQSAKLKRRAQKIEADLAAAEGADALRLQAELLQIHRHRLALGLAEVMVPNEFDANRPEVRIPLDPRLNPGENIERLFQRYQKLRDGHGHIARRLAETRAEIERLQALEAQLHGLQNGAVFDAFAATLTPAERKAYLPAAQGKARRGDEPRGVMTRTSADGYTIYVGRSKTENDEVTFRIGRGRDWWLHALGVPGAHVVVRNPGNDALPPATLRQAAWLAAYYSKGRGQKGLEVTCTQRKHVRKVKGGEPGQVTHALGRTVWVNLDDAQARAILGEVDASELDV